MSTICYALARGNGFTGTAESGVVSGFTEFTELDEGLAPDGDVTMPHARRVATDPRTHLVFFPLRNLVDQPVLRIMSGTPRPPAVSGWEEMGPRATGAILRGIGAREAFAVR